MSCFRSSEYNICTSEAYHDHRKLFFSDTNFMSLVSNSHIAPAWLTAEFFSPYLWFIVLYSILFPINVIFPSSSNFLSLLETFSIRASTTVTIHCLFLPALERLSHPVFVPVTDSWNGPVLTMSLVPLGLQSILPTHFSLWCSWGTMMLLCTRVCLLWE